MYIGHFGLIEAPFALTPNPRYLYMSERHREGLAHLLYGIQQPGGFVQLTGEVGTGKTTLCRCLLEQLPPEVDVALILNPRLTVVEFLAGLCDELHVVYPVQNMSVKVLVDALHGYLLDAHARGRRTVLIVDEAQNLSAEVLEQVRLLTNLETAEEKLLQIILIGQPELIRLLGERRLRQLAQRITARYHLLPFSTKDTCAYIRHRVQVAGRRSDLFTPMAMRWVRRLSGGVPRLINVICDRALLGAYAGDRQCVDVAIVRQAGREVRGMILPERRGEWLPWLVGLAAAGIVAIGLLVLGTPTQISLPWTDRAPSVASGDGPPIPGPTEVGDGVETHGAPARVSPGPGHASPAVVVASTNPTSPSLADLLADPSLRGDDHAAFATLCSLWGVEYRKASSGLACDAVRAAGLECIFRSGNWSRLRRFDLPAILELAVPNTGRQRVTLVALGEDRATLAMAGREYTFPLGEIERFWDGSFILVWKAPSSRPQVLSSGMRGKNVEWVRQRLDALEGRVSQGPSPDVYDAELERRVVAFQRSRSLTPDGILGGETWLHLALAVRESGVPLLSSRVP
jgi:general secretion pathway protein A